MSGEFALGQRVRYSEWLVRVSLHTTSHPRSEELLQSAMSLMNVSRSRGSRIHGNLEWKLWVPESFAREHLHRGLTMIEYSRAPHAGEGFIVQRATLQQGGTEHGYDGAVWMDHGTTRAYKVAFDLGRKPVHVLPESITAIEEPDVCPFDCDSCHDEDCPCDRLGCAGSEAPGAR